MGAAFKTAEELFVADLKRRGVQTAWVDAADIFPVSNARELYANFPAAAAAYFPYYEPDGQPMAFTRNGMSHKHCRIRRLEDAPNSFVKRKVPKYLQPVGSVMRVYFPRGAPELSWPAVLADPMQCLLVTEGEWKSLVSCWHGFPCLGLGGVFGFSVDGVFLPDLEAIAWEGRHVYIVFDNDLTANADVQIAERRIVAELIKRRAIVHPVRLPADANCKGVDDFLLARGPDALEQLLESTRPADPGKSLVLEGTDVEIADAVLCDLSYTHLSPAVFCDGVFYIYEGTRWRALPEHELRNAVFRYDTERFKQGGGGIIKLTKGRADSILSIMRDRAADPGFFAAAPVGVNCASGFIQFDASGNPELDVHDRDHRQRHCLPGAWEPGASWTGARLLDTFLRGCFGEDDDFEDRSLFVAEICGVAALGAGTKLKAPRAIVLHGPTAENGKSELLAVVRGLLPHDAVCSVPPTRFGDERMLVQLAGKLLNACDELGTTQAIASDTFKATVTGNAVTAKAIYKEPVSFNPSALHIYATNVLPPFHGGFDRGVQRRLQVLTFTRTIPKAEQIAEIGNRIATEEADALLAFAVDGAARVISNGQFTEPASCRAALREWVSNADPVLAWLANRTDYAEGQRLPTKQAYEDFQNWALTEGVRTDRLPTVATFVNRLCAQDGRITPRRDSKTRYIVGLKMQTVDARWAPTPESQPTVPAPTLKSVTPQGWGAVTASARKAGQKPADVTRVS